MSDSAYGDPARLAARLRDDGRRVVVLDDDPTGTQTVSELDVLLRPDPRRLDAFFQGSARALYVLTNTRAMPREEATTYLGGTVAMVDAAAARAGERWAPVLRGDSTLRGHVFAEADVLGARTAVVLFVPAFPEGGRVTVDGAQFVTIDGRRRNAADTEFAADRTFGYASRDLVSWVAETGGGRSAVMVPLGRLREAGAAAVSEAIAAAPAGTVVIPEAETVDDLRAVMEGLLDAEALGGLVVVRSASSFAAIRAGSAPRPLDRLVDVRPRRILVVCGSYTAASGEQLDALRDRGLPIVEVAPGWTTDELVASLRSRLLADGIAVIATPRARPDAVSIDSGAAMMRRLMNVVSSLREDVDAVVAKGGITSAEAAINLGAEIARVEGQVAPGIAMWALRLEVGRSLPYVVVPGNVGGPSALADVLDRLG